MTQKGQQVVELHGAEPIGVAVVLHLNSAIGQGLLQQALEVGGDGLVVGLAPAEHGRATEAPDREGLSAVWGFDRLGRPRAVGSDGHPVSGERAF